MTRQITDRIVYEGIALPLLSWPQLPEMHPRIATRSRSETCESLKLAFSTACRRHYVAYWEVVGGKLRLTQIRGMYRLDEGPSLEAQWYTGTLRMPTGASLIGKAGKYEHEFFARVENGRVCDVWNEENYDDD